MHFFCYPFPQQLSGALVLTFTGAFRNAQVLRDLLMPVIFQCEQHEYFPAAPGQVLYFILHLLKRGIQPPCRLLVGNVLYPFLAHALPADPLFAELDTFIDHDPPQPTRKSPRLFQLPQVPKSIDEGILQHILTVCGITGHPDADIIHGRAIKPVEFSLRTTVALPGLNHGQFMYVGCVLQVLVYEKSPQ